jgi:hypothetical protein
MKKLMPSVLEAPVEFVGYAVYRRIVYGTWPRSTGGD